MMGVHCWRRLVLCSFLLSLPLLFCPGRVEGSPQKAQQHQNDDDPPTNIHAMIVSSSRYWFNYRHAMNALGIYQLLHNNGVPNDQIVLMIADEYAINSRNPHKNGMYDVTGSGRHQSYDAHSTWYANHTEVDYRGADVTVRTFFDALLGTAPKSLPTTTNNNKNNHLLIYLTGHGGDQFFKFQDEEELTAQDIANLVTELQARQQYQTVLLIADTCQAFTLFDKIEIESTSSPFSVLALGTSLRDENAYAHHSDKVLGVSVIERWTHSFLQQVRNNAKSSNTNPTLHQVMVQPFPTKAELGAHVGIRSDGNRTFPNVLLSEFFGIAPTPKGRIEKTNPQRRIRQLETSSPPTITAQRSMSLPRRLESDTVFVERSDKSINSDNNETPPGVDNSPFLFYCTAIVLLLLVAVTSQLGRL